MKKNPKFNQLEKLQPAALRTSVEHDAYSSNISGSENHDDHNSQKHHNCLQRVRPYDSFQATLREILFTAEKCLIL